jgi:mRNA interferase RelE/StbE
MKLEYTEKFKRSFKKLSPEVQTGFATQLKKFLANPNPPYHPSLRIKKIQGTDRIFEFTVTMGIRMTFEFTEQGILLRNIGEHDLTLKKP